MTQYDASTRASEQVAFLHIPKTGGTSVIRHLAQRHGTALLEANADLLFQMRSFSEEFDAIAGHIPYFAFAGLTPGRTTFTILRDPRERTRSYIDHVMHDKNHFGHHIFVNRQKTLNQLLANDPFRFEVMNLQTRMLGFTHTPRARKLLSRGDSLAFYQALSAYRTSDVTDRVLDRAKAVLENEIDFTISPSLSFIASLGVLPYLQSESSTAFPRLRNSMADMNSDSYDVSFTEREDCLDSELYRYAVQLHFERLSSWIADGVELADKNGLAEPFTGLHAPERYRGQHLRWTDGAAKMPIPFRRSTDTLVTVQIWTGSEFQRDFSAARISVGEQRLLLESNDGDVATFKNKINTREFVGYKPMVLTIQSNTVSYHSDPRKLGVPLKSITVRRN